ncbi:MAG: hypothetical protein HY075_14905 [Deltaproteobacteria bacterium]|nr:hypothetical protein [Deltaproteobacteria bacterium]
MLLKILSAAGLLALAQTPAPVSPNVDSERPGADPQSNVGSSAVDPAFSNAPNGERNPPQLPPGTRDPSVTDEERRNVNPQGEEDVRDRNRIETRERPPESGRD